MSATAYVLPTVLCAVGDFGAQVCAGVRARGLPPWFDAACAQVDVRAWTDLAVDPVARGEAAALRQDPFHPTPDPARERNRLCVAVVADLRRGWPAAEGAGDGWRLLTGIRDRLRAGRQGIHRDVVVLARGPVPAALLSGAAEANVAVLQITDTDCDGRVWDERWVVGAAADAVVALVAAGLAARSEWPLGRGSLAGGGRCGLGCRLEAAGGTPAALEPRLEALVRRGAHAILAYSPDRSPRPEDDARTVLAQFPPRLHLSEVPRHADILRHRSAHLARIGRGPAAGWPAGVAAAEVFLSGRHLAWVARAFAELEHGYTGRYLQALDGMLLAYARTYVRPSWMQELCDQVRRQVLADAAEGRPAAFAAVSALQGQLAQKLARRVPREASALLTAVGVLFVAVYVRLFAPALLHGPWLVPLALLVLAPALGVGMDEWRIRQNLRALRDAVHDKYRQAEELLREQAERRVLAAVVAAVDARKAALVAYAKALEDAQAGSVAAAADLGLRPEACPTLDPLRTPAAEVVPALRLWAEGVLGLAAEGAPPRQPGREGWLATWDQASPLVSPPASQFREEVGFQLAPETWADPETEPPEAGEHPVVLRWALALYGTLRLVRWQADERGWANATREAVDRRPAEGPPPAPARAEPGVGGWGAAPRGSVAPGAAEPGGSGSAAHAVRRRQRAPGEGPGGRRVSGAPGGAQSPAVAGEGP